MRRFLGALVVLLAIGGVFAGGLLMGEGEETRMEFLYFGNLGATVVECPAVVAEWFELNSAFGVCGELPAEPLEWDEVNNRMLQSFVIAADRSEFIGFTDDAWVEDPHLGFMRALRFNLIDFRVGLNLESGLVVIARPELYWP